MGGLGPGIGGLEYLVIGIVALVVVGPERLPGMLRQLGKMVAKARGMANEFRASFDEMARQSELDELRKEVQALRDGQGAVGQGMVRLGDEANAAFKDIQEELAAPGYVERRPRAVSEAAPEFPDPGALSAGRPPASEAAEVGEPLVSKPRAPRKPKPKPQNDAAVGADPTVAAAAAAKPAGGVRPRASRKPKTAE